jgi:hypothetical protein
MRVGITDDKSNRAGQNLCLIRATRALLAPIAAQRVQCGATNATVRISEHRNQIVHELRHEEMIEKLTAPKAHIGAVMPKTFSYCRKSVETRPQQSTMRTPGVMRDRQLVHKGSVLIAHVVLRFAPRKEPDPDLGNALGMRPWYASYPADAMLNACGAVDYFRLPRRCRGRGTSVCGDAASADAASADALLAF